MAIAVNRHTPIDVSIRVLRIGVTYELLLPAVLTRRTKRLIFERLSDEFNRNRVVGTRRDDLLRYMWVIESVYIQRRRIHSLAITGWVLRRYRARRITFNSRRRVIAYTCGDAGIDRFLPLIGYPGVRIRRSYAHGAH